MGALDSMVISPTVDASGKLTEVRITFAGSPGFEWRLTAEAAAGTRGLRHG